MERTQSFDQLIANAMSHDFCGWDFSYLSGRMVQESVSWDYCHQVREVLRGASSALDIDTGGGELLASLVPLPWRTVATEGYAPNIPIARQNLESLGVEVVEVGLGEDEQMPFPSSEFNVVLNRHGGFRADEFSRILKPDGIFISQQVGGTNNLSLNQALEAPLSDVDIGWNLDKACAMLESQGFTVTYAKEEFPKTRFLDIGAVVYYLRAIPWQIANFSVSGYIDRLRHVHEIIHESGEFTVQAHRFIVVARKPAASFNA